MSSLQDRVHELLRHSNPGFAEDVPKSVAVDDMLQMLQDAEDALQAARARVDKIKADIARLES